MRREVNRVCAEVEVGRIDVVWCGMVAVIVKVIVLLLYIALVALVCIASYVRIRVCTICRRFAYNHHSKVCDLASVRM